MEVGIRWGYIIATLLAFEIRAVRLSGLSGGEGERERIAFVRASTALSMLVLYRPVRLAGSGFEKRS